MYRHLKATRSVLPQQLGGVRLYQSCTAAGVHGYRPAIPDEYQIPEPVLESRRSQSNLYRWVEAYRAHGHRIANVNPVSLQPQRKPSLPELDPKRYGLTAAMPVTPLGLVHTTAVPTVDALQSYLHRQYASNQVAVEFAHIESEHEREWLAERYEHHMQRTLEPTVRIAIARLLLESQAWDNFLATKFPSVKRYGAEGAEAMMAFFQQLFGAAVADEVQHIVLAMPHRGKLNLLTTMLGTRPAKIFSKFRGQPEFPADAKAMCDIASHFHASDDLLIDGKLLRVSMLHNPSHLEAANPASMGKARSKQQQLGEGAFGADPTAVPFAQRILNVQLHGDAAFAGQGINQEMLMMAGTPHFDVGGTIHMIVNNQVGFTTPGDRGRVTRYSSDLAKAVMAPVFHVNGDDPEALARVTQVAYEYQRTFRKDVFVDLNCFRRWGHNEVDDPTFTNPRLYDIIHARDSVPNEYARTLIADQLLTDADVAAIAGAHTQRLADELAGVDAFQPAAAYYERQWAGLRQASGDVTTWDTGLDYAVLRHVGEHSVRVPEGFNIHPHLLKTHVTARRKRIDEAVKIDWATAEAMAFGSLMYQGHNVRLSGEDVGRGTFSHRHAMLVDRHTNEMHIPLNTLRANGPSSCGQLEVANSILSEEAVLAFEYGMAIDNPGNLIVWEAQFGDFFNGAQIIIDAFIASAETKWMYANGLVILLPHGYDGAASEHSSCRMERFLQLTDSKETQPDGDDVNVQVINPTTPAQYFHALRRQIVRDFRKPLVVVAPKIMLRLAAATSTHAEMAAGTSFRPVLGDEVVTDAQRVRRVILCSGKHYYALDEERKARRLEDVAIVRVESLCPFPVSEINQELSRYKNANAFVWSQEEPRNMGAWSFVKPRFENMCGQKLKFSGRCEAATPAVGVSTWHKIEATEVVTGPFTI